MKSDLLCTWLGLPQTAWPPDPWTLLGVPREGCALSMIEERVYDRMSKLRCYQLSYPEEATEGMNRLAEAYIKLAEASSKTVAVPAPRKEETAVLMQTGVDWRAEPPPVRLEIEEEPDGFDEPVAEDEADATEVLVAKPFVAPAKPHARHIDAALMRELGQASEEATSNVGTMDAIIERVETTRRLLTTWDKVGKLLKDKSQKIGGKDTVHFANRLGDINRMMKEYPAFLGQPGKPGYRVVVLARLKIPLLIARAMSDEQREELLFDWQGGRQVLLEHRKYLRRNLRLLRRRSTLGLALHAVRAFVNDYPWPTLGGAAVVVAVVLIGGAMWWWR